MVGIVTMRRVGAKHAHIRNLARKVLDKPRVHRDGSEIEYRGDRYSLL